MIDGWTRNRLLVAVCAGVSLLIPDRVAARERPSNEPLTGRTDPRADVSAQLRSVVAAGRNPVMRWARLDDVAREMRVLYDSAAWSPLWSRDGQPTAAALGMLAVFAQADTYGLHGDDYDAASLRRLAGMRSAPPLISAEQRAAFDVALSANAARLVRALRFGRVPPRALHAELRFARAPHDLAGVVRELAVTANPAVRLAREEPPYLHYRLLRSALSRYLILDRDTSLLPLALPPSLRPGMRDAGVPRLRRLLVSLGDAPDSAAVDSLQVDTTLADALRRFQRRQGMEADGVVGAGTRARLVRPFADRAAQIALSLERWRWLPREFAEPPVIVNVPAFRLHAFASTSDREADLLSMDVVVGDAFDSRTPVFSDTIRYLVFSPYWDVPASIARAEILPKARRDPGYLARGDYELVDARGRVVPATNVALDGLAAGRTRVRQRPGPGNALGRVKFIFPNAHSVYLHDSPARAAFQRARRDVSHGCVRVADAARLATFLLRAQSGWDSVAVGSAMGGRTPRQVNLDRPVPVHIVYATAVAREDGRVFFYDDIYGHDRRLARLLAAGYPYAQ